MVTPDSLSMLRDALLWCAVFNYGVLLLWFGLFIGARDWIRRLHGRWFRLSADQFDAIHYAGMMLYKLAIVLLCLVPPIVLTWFVG